MQNFSHSEFRKLGVMMENFIQPTLGYGLRARSRHLIVDPCVCFFEAVSQADTWLPTEVFADERVITVASIDAFGSVEIVTPFQFYARDVLDDIDQLVDGNEFAAPEVDRLDDFAVHDRLGAFQAIVDVHETARLL